jgi:hypothetical protein
MKIVLASAVGTLALALGAAATTADAQQQPDLGDTDLVSLACDQIGAIGYSNGLWMAKCREVPKYPIEISPSGNRAQVVVRVKFEGRRAFEIVVKMQRSLWSVQSIG